MVFGFRKTVTAVKKLDIYIYIYILLKIICLSPIARNAWQAGLESVAG